MNTNELMLMLLFFGLTSFSSEHYYSLLQQPFFIFIFIFIFILLLLLYGISCILIELILDHYLYRWLSRGEIVSKLVSCKNMVKQCTLQRRNLSVKKWNENTSDLKLIPSCLTMSVNEACQKTPKLFFRHLSFKSIIP